MVRKGQIEDVVHVYIVKANVNGCPYDQLKWNRIQFNRTLADCAIDGRLPKKNLVTPQQAALEAVKWLERLEHGEISSVVRKYLEVELTPVQIEQRIRKYGDFTRLTVSVTCHQHKGYQSYLPKPIMEMLGNPNTIKFVIKNKKV